MKLSEIDFRSLDFKEVGLWPLVLRIGLIIAAAILAIILSYMFIISEQVSSLDMQAQQEQDKRKEFQDKYNLAANLSAYEKQMIEIKESYKKTLRELPQSDLLPELIDTISQIAENNGVKARSIKPGTEMVQLGFYKEMPIFIVLDGDYNGFGGFISDISKLSRVVTLHDFSIKRSDGKAGVGGLVLELNAKTYWLSSDKSAANAAANPAAKSATSGTVPAGPGTTTPPANPVTVPGPPVGMTPTTGSPPTAPDHMTGDPATRPAKPRTPSASGTSGVEGL